MSTELLPGEDPELLGGPDRISFYRLVHADLPITEGKPGMRTMTSVAAGIWTVDLAHTRAAFAARHLFGQTVHGTIAVTAGTIEVGKDGRPQRFHATLDPASIDTGHARRDADLRGKRFLAVRRATR